MFFRSLGIKNEELLGIAMIFEFFFLNEGLIDLPYVDLYWNGMGLGSC